MAMTVITIYFSMIINLTNNKQLAVATRRCSFWNKMHSAVHRVRERGGGGCTE